MTDTSAALTELTALFAETGVPAPFAARTASRLGADAAAQLRADPWRLLRVPGVQPPHADHFARQLLGESARPDDPRRGKALVVFLLTDAARQGHTVTPLAEVVTALERTRVPEPRRAVQDALSEGEILPLTEEPEFDEESFDDDAEPAEPEETLGLARWSVAEEAAAEGFQRLTATATPLLDDATVKEVRSGMAEDRSLAVTAALRTGVTLLRGAPDDVEETALTLAAAAVAHELRVAVVTATDRAAADLAAAAELPDATVTSLHRLLEPSQEPPAVPGAVRYGRGDQHPFDLDLVILPDASGLDVELCGVLVEACPDGAHLVLGAEPGALPPTGPGRILDDLETSETVPVIELDPAGPGGPLAELTTAVRGGELVAVEAPDREVVIVPAASGGEAVHRAVQLVTDSIPRALGIAAEDVQAVTLTAGGEAGATALNTALKARLNPGPGAFGGFDPGDRVVVAAPLPQAAVGEAGVVTGGGPDGLAIEFTGGAVTVAPADAARLRHGWAVPVALGRGTRRPAVVAVVSADGEAGAALSRPLAAAAFGLARRHLSVVQAAGPALARAVRETGVPDRRTRLARLVVQ